MSDTMMWSGWAVSTNNSSKTLGDERRAKQRAQQRAKNQKFVQQTMQDLVPRLFHGDYASVLSTDELNSVIAHLKENTSNQDYRDRHNFLVQRLAKGVRELDWNVDVPSQIHVYHSPKSPISVQGQRSGVGFRTVLDLSDQHFGDVEAEIRIAGRQGAVFSAQEVEAGRLLFSAIARGGILNANWLSALPKAIQRGVWVEDKGVSLELYMADVQSYRFKLDVSDASGIRRWFPDPVTALLLRQWYRKYGKKWPQREGPEHHQLEQLIAAFLAYLPIPETSAVPSLSRKRDDVPRISRWMLKHACLEAAKDHPGFLVHYASSLDAGPSVPRETLLRLETGLIARDISSSLELDESTSPMLISDGATLPKQDRGVSGIPKEQSKMLADLRRCLTHRKHDPGSERPVSSATTALERFLKDGSNHSVILRLIAQWLLVRLRSRALNKAKLKTASALRYLTTIGKPLLSAGIADHDVSNYDAEDWIAFYDRAIRFNLSTESKATRQQRLREFHDWLKNTYAVPDVDLGAEQGSPRNVDANLLTPREYIRAKSWLASISDKRQARICSLVLTLGYRCGLRRREVRHLRLEDLDGLMEPGFKWPGLRIMNQRGMTQKSQSAVRYLPMWLLLKDDELRELRSWVSFRQTELGGGPLKGLLFPQDGHPTSPVDNRDCFQLVTKAMRVASGDINLRFHHNRHSFATFMSLRLLETYPGEHLCDQWVKDESGEALLPHWGEDFSKLAQLGSGKSPTQKHLWELCTCIGHLTPGETMNSYSHLLDWLMASRIQQYQDPVLSLKQQAELMGVAASGIEKFRGRHKLSGRDRASELLSAVQHQWKPFDVKTGWFKGVLPKTPASNMAEKDEPRWLSPLTLYQMISNLEKLATRGNQLIQSDDKDEYQTIADHYDLPASVIREFAYRAELLATMETRFGTPRLRFYRTQRRKPRVLPKSRRDYATGPETFLAPPREKRLHEEAERVFRRLRDFHKEEPELVLDVLASAAHAFQRHKTQMKFGDVTKTKNFLRVIDSIGLKKRAFVELEIAPERDEKEAKRYWAKELVVPAERIVVRHGEPGRLGTWKKGTVDIDFIPDDRGYRSTWTVVKFVLASAIILLPPRDMVGGVLVDDWCSSNHKLAAPIT